MLQGENEIFKQKLQEFVMDSGAVIELTSDFEEAKRELMMKQEMLEVLAIQKQREEDKRRRLEGRVGELQDEIDAGDKQRQHLQGNLAQIKGQV